MPKMKTTMMKCWICGREGKTGEHLVKASDIKSYFGHISQEQPIYCHVKGNSIPVGSTKSKRLKSKALICNDCNSSLTQPYDKAWEKLSAYLRTNWTALRKSGEVDPSTVFPGDNGRALLDVHLYFVKLFGLKIVESRVPIEIAEFSTCLQRRVSHSSVYISFESAPTVKHKHAAITPMEFLNRNGIPLFAAWSYIIDSIAVNVIYSVVPKNKDLLGNTWHPSTAGRVLKLANLT
jgi:hypothetical protein